MVIGRSDERNIPDDAKGALRHRMAVEGSFAETIWAAVMTPHRKAGHMIAPDQAPTLLQSALETRGPSTHDHHVCGRVRHFLRRRHKVPSRGTETVSVFVCSFADSAVDNPRWW